MQYCFRQKCVSNVIVVIVVIFAIFVLNSRIKQSMCIVSKDIPDKLFSVIQSKLEREKKVTWNKHSILTSKENKMYRMIECKVAFWIQALPYVRQCYTVFAYHDGTYDKDTELELIMFEMNLMLFSECRTHSSTYLSRRSVSYIHHSCSIPFEFRTKLSKYTNFNCISCHLNYLFIIYTLYCRCCNCCCFMPRETMGMHSR